MARRFDAFVVFAEMRTGSNYLEESLNEFGDLACLGEVYNPSFIGHHNQRDLLGYDMDRREADPLGLLQAIMSDKTALPGFRLFHDHDPRVIDRVLPDPKIAKVILTRNPLDSYISRKIASVTGQWRLTDMKHAKTAKVDFDAVEFQALVDRLAAFQDRLRLGLQASGQTAFHLRYEDLNDADVVNGLAAYLGSDHRIAATSSRLKKQNPTALRDKVRNYDQMIAGLSDLDRLSVDRLADVDPARTGQVRNFVAHPTLGLLFCPIKAAPEQSVLGWMARLDGVGRDGLLRKMNQAELKRWMKAHPGFRSFSVLRHPLARAYTAFNRYLLPDDRPLYAGPRRVMRQRYKVPFPAKAPGADWMASDQRAAFEGYVAFLGGNLAGQTSVRVDQAWASQTAILQGIGQVVQVQSLIHEAQMQKELTALARSVGAKKVPVLSLEAMPGPIPLPEIYDGKLEQDVIGIYRHDYVGLGFQRWNKG